jgi:hypothetical protein
MWICHPFSLSPFHRHRHRHHHHHHNHDHHQRLIIRLCVCVCVCVVCARVQYVWRCLVDHSLSVSDDSSTSSFLSSLLRYDSNYLPPASSIVDFLLSSPSATFPYRSHNTSTLIHTQPDDSHVHSIQTHMSLILSPKLHFHDIRSQDLSHHPIDILIRDTFNLLYTFSSELNSLTLSHSRNAADSVSSHPLMRPDYCLHIKQLPVLRGEEGDQMYEEETKLRDKLFWNRIIMFRLPYVFAYAAVSSTLQFYLLRM